MTDSIKTDGCGTLVSLHAETTYGACSIVSGQSLCFKTFTDPVLTKEEIDSPDRCSGGRGQTSYFSGKESTAGSIGGALRFASWDTLIESVMRSEWGLESPTQIILDGNDQESFTLAVWEPELVCGFKSCGLSADTMSLTVTDEGFAQIEFGLVGSTKSAISNKPTATSATCTSPMSHINGVFSLKNDTEGTVFDYTSDECEIVDVSLNVANNISLDYCLGRKNAGDQSAGSFDVSGSITLYMNGCDLFEIYAESTQVIITFELCDLEGNKYEFLISNAVITSLENPWAENTDRLYTIGFKGLRSGTGVTANTLKISKTAKTAVSAPTIDRPPEAKTDTVGNIITLLCLASDGENPAVIKYQWSSSASQSGGFEDIAGETANTLVIYAEEEDASGTYYKCSATNYAGTTPSAPAKVIIGA